MDHHPPPQQQQSGKKTAELDPVLHSIGFEIEEVSPSQVTGRLPITSKCCQPFQVLHGGVSALVAEGLASMGAHMASGFQRVAGVSLSINHFRSAKVGDVVLVHAAPIHVGRSTQPAHGFLVDVISAAVVPLVRQRQGTEEFVAEIVSIGRIRHRNLVRLPAYCWRKDELILLYVYIPTAASTSTSTAVAKLD